MSKKQKLVLIDAHALIHRAYHALPPMNTRAGVPTNAVYGFVTMLLKVLSQLKPTYAVAAFDMKGPTFRHKVFKDYKAHRREADEELKAQFQIVHDVVEAFNIPILEQKGFEADDIIGTLVRKIEDDVEKIIVTGDKDVLQLIDEHTRVFTLRRGISDTIMYDEEAVSEEYGFEPKLLIDYKGLAGDPSDNIPGVAGIGKKTAQDLVARYGTIEQIFRHLNDLPTRAKNKLDGHKEDALQSRELATIRTDVDVAFSIGEAELADYDMERVRELFEELEFRSLMDRLPKSKRGGVQPTLLSSQLSKMTDRDSQEFVLPDGYHLVEGDEAGRLREYLMKKSIIAFDTETDGLGALTSPIVGMSFSDGKESWYVPVDPISVKEWRELLESTEVQKVGHNLKYDMEVLAQSGVRLAGVLFDTMLASYLLHPGARQHKLDVLAVQELGHHMISYEDLVGSKKKEKRITEVPLEQVAQYACEDADISFALYKKLAPQIEEERLQRVMEELEVPLIEVLAHIELAGVLLDMHAFASLQKRTRKRIEKLQAGIFASAGETFNINSTQQLRSVLYEKLKLPTDAIARTQSGFSTAASELEKLRGEHDIIPLLEEWRELTKLQGTYIETLPQLVHQADGRIHASFHQTVAATGRLSSSDPNLQNIPVRTAAGQEIRAAFIAAPDAKLVKADYSQLELRIAASLSEDKKMTQAFLEGADIHRATAALVAGVKPGEVTDTQRRQAKALNFGVLYGMGPQKFSQEAGVSREEARSFIERYRETYAGIAAMVDATVAQAEEMGYVETLFGRRRYLPEIHSRAPAVRAAAERAAFNFPVQGTAADILKLAMIALYRRIREGFPETKMVLTVHDELVCEVPQDYVKDFAREMQAIMKSVVTLRVPLEVDVAIGQNWRDMEAL